MKAEQLNGIKGYVERATPGPWIIEESRFGNYNAASVDTNYDLPACLMRMDDAIFVTMARQDIPQLVAEVERLQGELVSAIEHADYRIKYSGQLSAELAIAYDEIDRLKEESMQKHNMLSELSFENRRFKEGLETIQQRLFSVRGLNGTHDGEITGACIAIRKLLDGDDVD